MKRHFPLAAAVSAGLLLAGTASLAAPSVVIVNSIAALGSGGASITFDGANDSNLAAVATNFGVTFTPATQGSNSFISPGGCYSGIGCLSGRALGSTNNGLISDVSQAPNYSGSTLRGFDINFAQPISAFGLNVHGWGHQIIDHSFTLYNAANQLLGSYTFSQAGLAAGDTAPNGFAGFKVSGATVSRVRVAPDARYQDFVAFDNISFVRAPTLGVPEPTGWALMILGFGMAGSLFRRQRYLLG